MFAKTIPLFRLFGIQINLDYSWFIIFFLITFALAEGYYSHVYQGYPGIVYWFAGTVSAILLFASVLLHELSHSLVAISRGLSVKEIDLFIFGGVAMIEEEAPDPKSEFLIAIAGPIASFLIGFFFFLIAYYYPHDDLFNGVVNYLMIVNFILGFFNLVPAYPLDGGRVLRALLWSRKDLLTATKISSQVGVFFAYFLISVGILYIFLGNLNGLWYCLLGLFLRQAAKRGFEQTLLYSILSKYKVQNFLVTVKPLFPNQTLADVFNYYYPFYHLSIYPVISDNGEIRIVDISRYKRVPLEELEKIKVGDITEPLRIYISPFDTLANALKIMNKYKVEEVPVIYRNTVLGIIKRTTIESILERELMEAKSRRVL